MDSVNAVLGAEVGVVEVAAGRVESPVGEDAVEEIEVVDAEVADIGVEGWIGIGEDAEVGAMGGAAEAEVTVVGVVEAARLGA